MCTPNEPLQKMVLSSHYMLKIGVISPTDVMSGVDDSSKLIRHALLTNKNVKDLSFLCDAY